MKNKLKLLQKENAQMRDRLPNAAEDAIVGMMEYMGLAKLGAFDRALVEKDVIGMAQDAQLRGENFSDCLDTDVKNWCDDVVAQSTPISRYELLLQMALAVWKIWLFVFLLSFNAFYHTLRFSVLHLLLGIFCSIWEVVSVFYLQPRFFYDRGWKHFLPAIVYVALFVVFNSLSSSTLGSVPLIDPRYALVPFVPLGLCGLLLFFFRYRFYKKEAQKRGL